MADQDQKERALPPIHRIKEPQMLYMSTRIRWFYALGYTVGEIHNHLGLRYQQVRNVVTTQPKRASREDVPALDIEVFDVETDLEAMEAQALVDNMAAQRAEERALKKKSGAARRAARQAEDALYDGHDDEWVDEVTEQPEPPG